MIVFYPRARAACYLHQNLSLIEFVLRKELKDQLILSI